MSRHTLNKKKRHVFSDFSNLSLQPNLDPNANINSNLNQNQNFNQNINQDINQNINFNLPNQPNQFNPTQNDGNSNAVDLDFLPDIVQLRVNAQNYYDSKKYTTMDKLLPPPATVLYSSLDQGSSDPNYARLSLYSIPSKKDLSTLVDLPIALVLQPMYSPNKSLLSSSQSETNEENITNNNNNNNIDNIKPHVPLVDFGDNGPVRCTRCKAYINPFVQFISGGSSFICNLCQFVNSVPDYYYAPIDPATGRRMDWEKSPELFAGTVDFVVPKEYNKVDPTPLKIVFLIDVSTEAINKELPSLATEAIRKSLYGSDTDSSINSFPENSKIAIVTFDRKLHFYNLSPQLTEAQMIVMPDIQDPFLPIDLDAVFVDPNDSRLVIEDLLSRLPLIFSEDSKIPEPAFGSALTVAVQMLKSTGGQISAMLAALPTWGLGRLVIRGDPLALKNKDEYKLLTEDSTNSVFYKNIGTQMAELGIGFDLFAFTSTYNDIGSLSTAVSLTGGSLQIYNPFIPQRDGLRFVSDFAHSITNLLSSSAYMAELKVRSSTGLDIQKHLGRVGSYLPSPRATSILGVVHPSTSIAVVFQLSDKLDSSTDAHFQAALLYTTASGQRRVRTFNILAGISTSPREVYKFADTDAIINVFAKQAADYSSEKDLEVIRQGLSDKLCTILATYRHTLSSSSPAGQLVLPEALRILPLLILSLLKCKAIRNARVSLDVRATELCRLQEIGVNALGIYLYPYIYPLHLVPVEPEQGAESENSIDPLSIPPSPIRATYSALEEGGVYLADNGYGAVLLWFHERTSPLLVQDLFGDQYTSLASLDPHLNSIPILDTKINIYARNCLNHIAATRNSPQVFIQLARQGIDGTEYEFAASLVEDKCAGERSYVDFLSFIHKQVQIKIAESLSDSKNRFLSFW